LLGGRGRRSLLGPLAAGARRGTLEKPQTSASRLEEAAASPPGRAAASPARAAFTGRATRRGRRWRRRELRAWGDKASESVFGRGTGTSLVAAWHGPHPSPPPSSCAPSLSAPLRYRHRGGPDV